MVSGYYIITLQFIDVWEVDWKKLVYVRRNEDQWEDSILFDNVVEDNCFIIIICLLITCIYSPGIIFQIYASSPML